jgi:hypothetical protein
MRSWTCQFGISLEILIAWPLLGGSEVRAAFLVRAADVRDTGSGMTGGDRENDGEPSQRRSTEAAPDPARFLRRDFLSRVGPGHSAIGSGFGGTSIASNAGGSVLRAAASSSANLSSGQLVRWLYFEDVHYRPQPFASRLFRPPRHGAATELSTGG